MKKNFTLLALVLIASSINVFAGGSKDSRGGNGRLFGYTCMDMTNTFLIAVKDSIEASVTARGDKLITVDGANNQTKQNDGIDDMITRGITVLFLNPVDRDGVKPALEACQRAGVKVIAVDSGVTDTHLTESFISSNNYQAGVICGEEMKRVLPPNAKVALIDNPLAQSVVERMSGLQDALKGSSITIVEQSHYSNMNAVLPTFEDFLQAHPDVNAFWGLNGDFGLIAQGVVESAGMQGKIKVFCVDGSPAEKKSIKNKGLWSTAAQSPTQMGQKSVEVAYDMLAGKPIQKEYSVDTVGISQDNISQFNVDTWQ